MPRIPLLMGNVPIAVARGVPHAADPPLPSSSSCACWHSPASPNCLTSPPAGGKRVDYSVSCTRWNDNDTTIPLLPLDTAWTALNLAFSALWTQEGTVIEVNNPTRKTITTTISSPKAITDRIAIHTKVKVPAGTTIVVTIGK